MESNHPLPPTTTKRIREKSREVSSRYLSTPSPSPFLSSSHTHTQKIRTCPSTNSSPESTDTESEFANENLPRNPYNNLPRKRKSSSQTLNKPFPFNPYNKLPGAQRKTEVKLLGDNGAANVPRKGRPVIPYASFNPKAAILSKTHVRNGKLNPNGKIVNIRGSGFRSVESCSDAFSVVSDSEIDNCSVSNNGGFCDSPPITGSRCSRTQDGFTNSMPEADLLPSISSRSSQNDSNESQGAVCRFLNLGLSSSQQNPFQNKTGRYVPSRICLPPQVPSNKINGKGKKGSKQEETHLKLLQNKYLQWRFVNAKAKEAVNARTVGVERLLYGLSVKIAEMKNEVMEKRIEVETLKRMQDLSLVLESQMPYLDKYSNLEDNYCSSLTGLIEALQDCSLRLPTTENVRADVNELKQVFDSMSPSVGRFIPKTEEVKDEISNLADVASVERALVEECGNLLSEAHNLQLTECSLRGQLIQAKQSRKV